MVLIGVELLIWGIASPERNPKHPHCTREGVNVVTARPPPPPPVFPLKVTGAPISIVGDMEAQHPHRIE